MIALIWLILGILASPFKSKYGLEADNAALRHQVMVLRRLGGMGRTSAHRGIPVGQGTRLSDPR
jgi:hypothetical protein